MCRSLLGSPDVLQIPAFLCRQTDLLVAAGKAGRPVNIKKGQWMSPEEMRGAVEKVRAGGAPEVAVTERGTFFGYGDLVVDMRSFHRLRAACNAPVIFDATHAVQQPGQGRDGSSGGERAFIPPLLYAAAAAGADGFFLETHPDPARAPPTGRTWCRLITAALSAWRSMSGTASARPSVHKPARVRTCRWRRKQLRRRGARWREAAAVQRLAETSSQARARHRNPAARRAA
jgi:3-deoxy-8-phosphooctulonate synthase